MNIFVEIDSKKPFTQIIDSIINRYIEHFGFIREKDIEKANACIYYGSNSSSNKKAIIIPIDENDLIPETLNKFPELSDDILGPGTIEISKKQLKFSNDIFAFCAGQLYRAEELEDEHFENAINARSKEFLGDLYNFFDRPIVDLIFLSLFKWLSQDEVSIPKAKTWLSFDVDVLQKWTWRHRIKHFLLIPAYALSTRMSEWFKEFFESMNFNIIKDPYFQVPNICRLLSKKQATFFFLGKNKDHISTRYDLSKSPFAGLPGLCLHRDQMAGLHSSPLNKNNPEELLKERLKLSQALSTAQKQGDTTKFDNIPWISRQHFLQIEPGKTLNHLAYVGIKIDSSLGFNDRPGFRCGTCLSIPWYNIEDFAKVPIIELPLIIADFQIHNPKDFCLESSLEIVNNYLEQVKRVGGTLSILFHNLYFAKNEYPQHSDFFIKVLELLNEETGLIDATSFKDLSRNNRNLD